MSAQHLSRNPGSLMGRLLSAGDRDEPSPRTIRKVLVAVGVASSVTGTAGTASAGTVGTLIVIKWLTVGVIAGASLALAGGEIADRARAGKAPSSRQASSPSVSLPSAQAAVPAPALPSALVAESTPPSPPAGARGIATTTAPAVETPPTASAPVKPPGTLSEEAAAIEQAGSAVRHQDGASALRALDEYQARFPRGRLYPEATALRVQALLLVGQRDAARETAARFLRSYPESPSAKRLRTLVGRAE